jgi:hypothetical protein
MLGSTGGNSRKRCTPSTPSSVGPGLRWTFKVGALESPNRLPETARLTARVKTIADIGQMPLPSRGTIHGSREDAREVYPISKAGFYGDLIKGSFVVAPV